MTAWLLPRSAGVILATLTLGVLLQAPVALGPLAAAGASGTGSLHTLRCTPLSTDAPLEAPQYAQEEGASDVTDEWWCDLPHATELPTNYVELKRLVAPLTFPYALYSTYYGARGTKNPTTISSSSQPHVTVTDDVNSTPRRPGKLQYPAAAKGKSIALAKGVSATLVTAHGADTVTWRYPTKGVPRYLQGVATVTVAGTGVPEAVVVAVARHVEPD